MKLSTGSVHGFCPLDQLEMMTCHCLVTFGQKRLCLAATIQAPEVKAVNKVMHEEVAKGYSSVSAHVVS